MILKPNQRENILPLPIVLITTISKDGVRNAAPYSNFTPILRPLDDVLLASWIKRDTLENIRQTGEFVVNIPPVGMEDAVMICARNYPPEVDEFQEAKLRSKPSIKVKPPGIEGCLAWAECLLLEEIAREKFVLIIGKVVHLEVDDQFFNDDGRMDFQRAKPLGAMLGRDGLSFTYPVFSGRHANYAEMSLSQENTTSLRSDSTHSSYDRIRGHFRDRSAKRYRLERGMEEPNEEKQGIKPRS